MTSLAHKVDGRTVARRVFRDLDGGQRLRLLAAGAAMTVSALLKALVPLLIGSLVARSVKDGDVAVDTMLPAILQIAVVVLVQQAAEVCRRQLVESVGTEFERNNRVRVYGRILHRDLDDLGQMQSGALNGRATRTVEGTTKLLKLFAMDLLPSVITSVAAVAVVFSRDWRMAVVMAAVIPTGFLITRAQVRSQSGIRRAVRDHKERVDGDMAEIVPVLAGVRTVGAEAEIIERIGAHATDLRETELRHHRAMSLFDAMKFVNEAFWQIVVLCVAVALLDGSASDAAGDVTTYALLFAGILAPLRDLHRIVDEAAESGQQASDFYALLDAPLDAGFAEGGASSALRTVSDPNAPAVAISGLSFGHRYAADGERGPRGPVLAEIDLEVAAGERVGIVGSSGCGKSTLLRLLRRLHHGYEGAIELFGDDLRQLDHAQLTQRVGYVAQEPHLLRGTIADNIRLGRPEATDEEVLEAARRAHVARDVLAMPDGFATKVGERGTTLSGGQRQRICIARALLSRPQLLLLDEPTSALDPVSQQAVQATIDALTDVTVVVVAHRLDTLSSADRIVVLEAGQVAQIGTFDELKRAGGAFGRVAGPGAARDVATSVA